MRIPRHLAIIMDGNGRWARQKSQPRVYGHRQGVETVRRVVEECSRLGVEYLTLYAFSYENWGRPDEEISALMELLTAYLKKELETMLSNSIRFNVIGDIDRLPASVRCMLTDTIERTEQNSGMTLTLALSYGSRDEITRAMRKIARRVADGEFSPDKITESMIDEHLDTVLLPEPDLLIRTSGEMRISNFLLWQMAYTELYFTPTLWPDFDHQDLHDAFRAFGRRRRRFGLTDEQRGGGDFDD
jgi:undecaprenyl diphosphate synthase